VLDAVGLRALGSEELLALLRRREELLYPVPPRSLQELAGRLGHRAVQRAAVLRSDLPTLQVLQALAALGSRADRPQLFSLLGVRDEEGAPGGATLDRVLNELDRDLLLDRSPPDRWRVAPGAVEMLSHALGLGADVAALGGSRSPEELRAALTALGVAPSGSRPTLVESIAKILGDGDRVRRLLEGVPQGLRDQLTDVAHGRSVVPYYFWQSGGRARRDDPVNHPLDWATARFLLVPDPQRAQLSMPAEVARALRGPGWTAPFTPDPPPVTWGAPAPDTVAQAAHAAAAAVLRLLGATVTAFGEKPVPLLKSGAIGVRELRRLAGLAGCAIPELRFVLELAFRLGLLTEDGARVLPTDAWDRWQRTPAATRYADLLDTWVSLPGVPLAEADGQWQPPTDPSRRQPIRLAVLAALAAHPDAAPSVHEEFAAYLRWMAPVLFDGLSSLLPEEEQDDDLDDEDDLDDLLDEESFLDEESLLEAILSECTGLGVTGAGALSAAGRAVLEGGDVAAAVGDGLGVARTTARLLADLTAVVLGDPSADLAAALDRVADRENRSTATVWRFSPASVRRAMDAGADADTLLGELKALGEGDVPQPLEYLLRDVARRHGRVRGAAVACYLRSDYEALLAELAADRRLAALGLRRLAPTVLVGEHPWPRTLAALRAAGYAPVEEDSDGAVVAHRVDRHRATSPKRGAGSQRSTAQNPKGSRTKGSGADGAGDPPDVVATLLAAPDAAEHPLVDIGTTVVAVPRGKAHLYVPDLGW